MNQLKSSININQMTFKNRLVLPPIATSKSDNGEVNSSLLNYYHEKSLGGYIGLIIAEHMYIDVEGQASEHQISISKDEDIPGLTKLVNVIHHNHTPVFAQINHAGSKSICKTKRSASAISHPFVKESHKPEEMTIKDIDKGVEDFVKAALRAKKAGFDGVEIHAAHGYLLNQFYSPLTNHRTDDYGGVVASRLKIHLRIIAAVREAVGKDYPLAIRLGACDYENGGNAIEDALEAAIILAQAGVDLLDISGGLRGYIRPHYTLPGYYSDITKLMKQKVSIPVLLTGGITSRVQAETLLENQCADLIGVGRAIFADSKWAEKCMNDTHQSV